MSEGAIVIGVSSGGMNALKLIFSKLPPGFRTPIIVVQHVSPRSDSGWISLMNDQCALQVREAQEKEPVLQGHIYFAPPNYHLLIENDRTFSLTIDERVNYARPAIDVLFESAADAYGAQLTGIILTGANHDGTAGMRYIRERGGRTIVQDPATAASPAMPASVIAAFPPDHVLPLEEIVELLIEKEITPNTNDVKQ